ncbi:hypothetical protein WA026_022596 [Henosepilachna vigintioctopunctata]|uniref:Amine oxidase domain-containing protein n=1 Tax=Henosepilachna vigintioctopunctata TaxID=420089 RepID=A0AAW1V5I7_9CUCU
MKTGNTLLDEFISITEETSYTNVNISIGEAFSSRYNATCLKKYKDDPKMLTYSHDFLRTIECIILTTDGAFSWNKISSMSNFKFQSEENFLQWDGLGYKTILDLLLKNYPQKTGYNIDHQLSLEKTVTRIILKNNSVKIKCKDGSEYSSDHVVFTPSLGVLKHEHKNLFMPRLKRPKVDAIEDLGFDGVIKVILEFTTPWWRNSGEIFLVWNEEKRKNLAKDIPFGPTKDGDHWLSWFYLVGTSPNNSKALVGWILGPMVPKVEKLSKDQMKTGVMYTLKTFLGKDFNITEPIKVIHSKWYMNPNIRGTYSYETLISKKHGPSAQEALAEPITAKDGVPRILFAGEATSSHRFGTVDGAVETGYREADRLLKILKVK